MNNKQRFDVLPGLLYQTNKGKTYKVLGVICVVKNDKCFWRIIVEVHGDWPNEVFRFTMPFKVGCIVEAK